MRVEETVSLKDVKMVVSKVSMMGPYLVGLMASKRVELKVERTADMKESLLVYETVVWKVGWKE